MNPRQDRSPAAVIAFPPPTRRPRPASRTTRAEVIDLVTYRRALELEVCDAVWDRLEELGRAAWTWRDPESVDALAAWVMQLRMSVRADWESGREVTDGAQRMAGTTSRANAMRDDAATSRGMSAEPGTT